MGNSNNDKRLDKVEGDIQELRALLMGMSSDFKFIKEKIENYLQTHDKVVRLEEQIKVSNKRMEKLENMLIKKTENAEDYMHELSDKINAVMVKVASVSAIVSIGIG